MKKDWFLFADIILIIALGITTLYSTVVGEQQAFSGGGVVNKQLIFVLLGLIIYFTVSYIDYRFAGHPQIAIPLYSLVTILLVLVLIIGVEINFSKRWIVIGNFQFQVSELAKISVIIMTAWLFSLRNKYNVWILGLISGALTLIISLLVFLEPDASTSMMIMMTWAIMAITILPQQLRNLLFLLISLASAVLINTLLAGSLIASIITGLLIVVMLILGLIFVKKLKFILLAALVVGGLFGVGVKFAWTNVFKEYQRQRIECFWEPEIETQGACFQVQQAKVAIGSGKIFGKGFGHGTQSKLKFLPEHQTDFIFAAFAEEFGLIGSLFLIGLYSFLIFRILSNAHSVKDIFGFMLIVGIGVKILLEVLINIGMNLGAIPATGIPLPLMSAGGSIFLMTMLGLGLVQSVSIHNEDL